MTTTSGMTQSRGMRKCLSMQHNTSCPGRGARSTVSFRSAATPGTRSSVNSRWVSILVLGSNLKKWNKNWNKFELRLDNFTPIFIPIFGGPKFSGINIRNWNCLLIFPNLNVPKVGIKIGKCLDYVPKLHNCDPKNIKALSHECNTSSLGLPERLKRLVAVQTRCVSWRRMYSHMYPWICAPSNVSSDMYVKDVVLCRARQWEPWSTSVK
jgi:hypothetical protein